MRHTTEGEAINFLRDRGVKVTLNYRPPYSLIKPLKSVRRGIYSLRILAMCDCLVNHHGYIWE
jgi:hypothetical protein